MEIIREGKVVSVTMTDEDWYEICSSMDKIVEWVPESYERNVLRAFCSEIGFELFSDEYFEELAEDDPKFAKEWEEHKAERAILEAAALAEEKASKRRVRK